jgi:nucleoside-diphosphate-sugar epimerase
MKILVTGNLGYIGSVLTSTLIEKGFDVTGIDIGYFENNLVSKYAPLKNQIKLDIRNISESIVEGHDAIIHLASLSNDPLGEFNPNLTNEINNLSTVKLAEIAKKVGVKRFVYASTQSIYGISNTSQELDEYESIKNPVSAYAKTKWISEQKIMKMSSDNFIVTAFRPATVFGPSPRFRCDIVYNNLLSCAYTTGKIEIYSDGTPCRPIVHIDDVCNAFISGLIAPKELINKIAFNVGIDGGNYTVKQIAEAAQIRIPNSKLIFTGKYGKDERTYKVSFKRIYRVLKDFYKPLWNLESGGDQLLNYLKDINISEEVFRGPNTNRLKQLKYLSENNLVDNDLKYHV